ncbi:MAG TPA: tetratricopeptide repeat protein [Bacteroidota bacterium]
MKALVGGWGFPLDPLFQTDERTPEIMEVFEFGVDGVQFIPYDVSQLMAAAAQYIGNGSIQQGGSLIQKAIQAAPNSSRAHYWMGRALLAIMKPQEARDQFQTAVRLHPRYWDAMLGEAQARQLEGFPDSAITVLEKLMDENPSYAPGLNALANLYQESKDDSIKTTHYRNRYLELMKTGTK